MCAHVTREAPLYEQIYTLLKQMIMSNELKPNERIIDTQLAAKFQTSRSPIREALRKLEQDGIIVNNRGIITVYAPSLKDVVELYKVRVGLEYVAAYWATEYMDEDTIIELRESLLKTKIALEKKDYEKVVELNTFFHDTILQASQNERLISMMKDIRTLIVLYRQILFENYSVNYNFLDDHELIIEAIAKGDSNEAANQMVTHINHDMDHFKAIFNKQKTDNSEEEIK